MRRIRQWLGLQDTMTVPMMLICFLICFVHSVVRNMKDSLVITAQGGSAEVVPFIQVWMMLPATLIATYLFTKIATRYSQEKLFYVVIGAFIAFFTLFTFVLYPLRDILHPHQTADYLTEVLPKGFKGMISMMRNWTFSGFYTFSELWAALVTPVLFWGFANQITRVEAARSNYGLYAMGGNFGATVAGSISYLTSFVPAEYTIYLLMSIVITSCCIILAFFRHLNRTLLSGPKHECLRQPINISASSMGLKQAFGVLLRSKYLLCMGIMVFAYNLVLSLGELVWRDQLNKLYPNFNDYNACLGYTTMSIGVLSLILAAFLPKIIGSLGWTRTALICPLILLTTGGLFLGCLYFGDLLPFDSNIILLLAVFFGALMDIGGRATKNSVFDATKDMAYIPLDPEIKLKGKATIDGAISRIGRCTSAASHQVLILVFSSIGTAVPAVAVILCISVGAWILATTSLGKQFNRLINQKESVASTEEVEPAAVAA
ncbi:MAG: Npt1/Npt2 family nucleotide transporter [Chlamydiales bacterium]|nr:Npt1/Npt2 family nucleotide transporter [Chlamydiales bacterium]